MKKFQSININDKNLVRILTVIFCFAYLAFILDSGYCSDDTHISVMKGILEYRNISIGEFLKERMSIHLALGRFFPVTVIVSWIFPGLLPLKIYKLCIVLMCIGNLFLLGKLVKKITNDDFLQYKVMLVTTVLFTLLAQTGHSAFLSFGMNVQFLLAFSLISFIKYIDYCKGGKRRDCFISLFFWLLGLLTYEVAYMFIFVFIFIAYYSLPQKEHKIKYMIKYLIPYAIVGLIMFSAYIFIHMMAAESYAGASLYVSLASNIKTFIKQLLITLPFVNFIIKGPDSGLTLDIGRIVNNIEFKDIFLVALFLLILYVINRNVKYEQESRYNYRMLFIFGMMIMLFPVCLVAVSEKYQSITFGMGYITVYIQYFGLALIIVSVLYYILIVVKKKRFLRILIKGSGVCIFCIMILLNQQNSRLILDDLNSHPGWTDKWIRTVYEEAASNGILDSIDPNTDVIITTYGFFDLHQRGALMMELTGKRYNVYQTEDKIDVEFENEDLYALHYVATKTTGFVILGNISNGDAVNIDGFTIYIKDFGEDYNAITYYSDEEIGVLLFEQADEVRETKTGVFYTFNTTEIMKITSIVPARVNR